MAHADEAFGIGVFVDEWAHPGGECGVFGEEGFCAFVGVEVALDAAVVEIDDLGAFGVSGLIEGATGAEPVGKGECE